MATILIVDDHPIVRQGLRRLIEAEADLEVCGEAETAREAKSLIRELEPDAVIVDVSLKQGDGLELVKDARAHYPSLPLLVLSMHDEAIYAERCGLSGDPLRTAVAEFQRSEAESVRRGVRSFPGVPEMLASLRPWRLGAITNKRHDTTLAALGAANLGDRFAIVLGGDSVARKKPAPDPVLQAARELGIPAESCAVVGDTEVDVHAGREAGAVTVGVTWGYGIRARLEDAGVGYLVETPAALPPLLRALTPSTGT